jgi:ribosomal protein L9
MNSLISSFVRPTAIRRAAGFRNNTQSAKRWGHTVRLIAMEDLPHGKAYEGDVVRVKAGFARNYLIPKKKAVYATPQNFERLQIVDPDVETEEQRIARLQRESSMNKKDEEYLKQADMLKKYLRNKVVSGSPQIGTDFDIQSISSLYVYSQLKIWRVVDPNTTDVLYPGLVNASNLRQKLGKQLKIDLEPNDKLHIYSDAPLMHAELDESKQQSIVDAFTPEGACEIEIKRLGEYLAKISLPGGYSVPLKLQVIQRVP